MDDTWLSEDYFVENLESIVGDKLFDHKQLKMKKKIFEGKEDE